MTLNLSLPPTDEELRPRITVIGVGGAGGNAVNNMIRSNLEGVDFLVANTDAQAMKGSICEECIQLGRNITGGLGAGSKPEIGRAAAEEALDDIAPYLEAANMVFITAGMGGGTGTGAAPVIARAAREIGVLTVGVVTRPFQFEGVHRMRIAENGIQELTEYVDTLIIIPNQNLFRIANEKTTFADAFKMADDVLYSGVRGVTDLMVMPGLINLDFADIRSVMTEMGKAMMGTGEAENDGRAIAAAEAAISNPLLDEVSMKGARGVLINITGGMDMTLFEVDEAANRIRDEVDPEANIIFGSTFDESLNGSMRVSVVATGIEADHARQPKPVNLSVISSQARAGQSVGTAAAPGTTAQRQQEAPAPQHEVQPEPVAEQAYREQEERLPVEPEQPEETLPESRESAIAAERIARAVARQAEEREAFLPPAPQEAPRRQASERTAAPYTASGAEPARGDSYRQDAYRVERSTEATAPTPRHSEPAERSSSESSNRRRPFSLFAKATGLLPRAAADEESRPQETRPQRNEPRFGEGDDPRSQAPNEAEGANPQQPSFAGMDPAAGSAQKDDEDLLDIPSFLRRQAN